jgi:LysM repeat protein
MSEVRQALTGILAALISAVIIFGSIILALSETGQKVARQPESYPTLPTPMPPVATSKPGEPTYTAAPTRLPETPTIEATLSCAQRPGWEPINVIAGDSWESLAHQFGTSLEELLQANCMQLEDIKNNKLGMGMLVYIKSSQITDTLTPTGTSTATPTHTPEPTKAKSAQTKPKPTRCAGPPSYWVRYTVRSGDTLTQIGRLTGATVAQLRSANCLPSSLIRTGQRLWVPHLPPPPPTATRRPTRIPTLTRTSPPPTVVPPDTAVPSNTPRPTDPPPPPSDTPPPTEPPPPTAYP